MANFKNYGKKNWGYRFKYKDPITGKNKEKSQRGFERKDEAEHAAAIMKKKLEEAEELTDNISLKHFLNEWLNHYKKPTLRKNTIEIHKRNIDNHILPYFKEILLNRVKPIMYQKFLNHLAEKDYSKRTIELIHGTMFGAMKKASALGKIERNPCFDAVIPTKKSRKDEGLEYLESEHVSTFLTTAYQYDYIYWIFFKVLIETGMRKGEAAALQWSDIDLKEGKIYINKTLDFQAGNEDDRLGDPKTYNSKRNITISKSLINDLHFHKKYQNQNKLALNEIYYHDLNLVLCRNDGNFMPKSTLFNAFSRILKQAGLKQLPIHSLRHTHAVLLLEAGAEMKYVQERLGHGSIQITSDVYAHISKKIEKDTMDKYESYMDNILK